MKKPTGTGKRPESVTRAKAIDKLINEKVGTRDLDDSELDNNDDDEEGDADSDNGRAPPVNLKKHTVVARSDKNEAQPARRTNTRGSQHADLAERIANSLDPEAQRQRDEERSNRSLHTAQIFTLTQQLRDSNNLNESLRAQLVDVRERLNTVERLRDRLDAELNLERRMSQFSAPGGRGLSARGGNSSHKYNPELTRVRGKIRHDEFFPDGGQCTSWISDGSSASDWEENKENLPAPPIFDAEPSSNFAYKPQHRKYGTHFPSQSDFPINNNTSTTT